MNGMNRIRTTSAVILMALLITGCPSSNSTNPPSGSGNKTVSTNSSTNANVLSSFTGPNSVTISGSWTNVTFASTGGLTVEIEFDFNTNMATITWDIDGNVYGGSDPAPEVFMVDMTDFINNGTDTQMVTSSVFGDVTVTLSFFTDNTGTFTGTADNVPGGSVTDAAFSGSFEISGSTVTFTLDSATFTFISTPVTMSHNLTTTIN